MYTVTHSILYRLTELKALMSHTRTVNPPLTEGGVVVTSLYFFSAIVFPPDFFLKIFRIHLGYPFPHFLVKNVQGIFSPS